MDAALTAAAIGVGGTVIVGVAGFWANVRNTNKLAGLTEQGQLTDRYSKAIEQLGSDKLDVRIGGIYALERIAHDSPRDHPTIMEVLAAFIRDHSQEQWPPAKEGAEPPERATRPDVQAAATVIGRRTAQHDSQPINLEGANLTSVDLSGAGLSGADLTNARLAGANLIRTNLARADLTLAFLPEARLATAFLLGAYLRGANLTGADLTNAHLTDANLAGANLTSAYLRSADLTNADLTAADLTGAHLRDANLTGTNLLGADLTNADITRATWPADEPLPKGWQRDADSGFLNYAGTDLDPGSPAASA